MVNTGQMLLILGALLLFTLMLPSLNETILYSDRTLVTANAELAGLSLAQKYLADAGCKVFDEVCLTCRPKLTSQLTVSPGRESGENYPNIDDLDDFHNLTLTDTTTLASIRFTINLQISYMNPANPTQTQTSQSFIKRLRVTITSPFLMDPANNSSIPIVLEQLYAYY